MDKKFTNYYELLGVEPAAEVALIAQAAKAKAQQINQAFRMLNDPQQREKYNAQLAAGIISPSSDNFYTLLEIATEAAIEQVKPAAQARALEIDKAFRILCDPEKRKLYDNLLTQSLRKNRPTKRYVNTVGRVSPRESVLRRWLARLIDNFSTFETPSAQDIVIFVLALAFFIYMVSLFFK